MFLLWRVSIRLDYINIYVENLNKLTYFIWPNFMRIGMTWKAGSIRIRPDLAPQRWKNTQINPNQTPNINYHDQLQDFSRVSVWPCCSRQGRSPAPQALRSAQISRLALHKNIPIMDQISIKTPNPKCRLYWCLIEFVYWRYSQSCWYFRPQNPLPPHLPRENK